MWKKTMICPPFCQGTEHKIMQLNYMKAELFPNSGHYREELGFGKTVKLHALRSAP